MITQEVLGGMVLGLACALAGGLVVFLYMLWTLRDYPRGGDSDHSYSPILPLPTVRPEDAPPSANFPRLEPYHIHVGNSTTRS